MNSRTVVAVLAVPAALALAACSSTVNGTPQAVGATGASGASKGVASGQPASSTPPTSPVPTSSGPTSPTPTGSTGTTSNNGAHLGTQLAQGLETAKTAHLSLAVGVGSQAILAVGNETLHDGQLVSLQLKESIPGAGDLSLIIAGGKTYVKLPPSLQTGTKPWLLVRAGSSNKTVQVLATVLASTKASASLETITDFVTAAQSIKDNGQATAGGIATTHYSIIVSVAKLPASYPGKSALQTAGLATIPLQLFVDSSGRPVRVKETLAVEGQQVQTKINVTRYNLPITISAPPKSQVSSG